MEQNHIKYLNDPTKTIDYVYIILLTSIEHQHTFQECKTTFDLAYNYAIDVLSDDWLEDYAYVTIHKINPITARIVETREYTKKDVECK